MGLSSGFPKSYRDPSFFEIADRFLLLAEKYNFNLTIFVIGRDLENPLNQEAVKNWSAMGHEIGNHSWSHRPDMGRHDREDIRGEVEKAHQIITKVVGKEPKGFIAPSWAFSSVLADVLIEYGYEYDSSPFPSWLMFPLAMRIWYVHRNMDRGSGLLTFENFKYALLGKRDPHLWPKGSNCQKGKGMKINEGKIVLLPVPSTKMRVACWHTLSFILGKNGHQRILKNALEQTKFFYYLMHPADLMVRGDLCNEYPCHFARIDRPLKEKVEMLEASIRMIIDDGRTIVTMQELAENVLESTVGPDKNDP